MSIIDQKQIVVVIGPGRSGTSAITRGLKVFGVDLGENLMPPKPGVNDKGFWEDQDIYSLNRDIFKEIEHDWHRLTPVDFNILPRQKLNALKLRAIEVVRKKLKSTNLFGMKDPQITRLLPFWRDVFAHLSVKDSYVIACRNPMSVARSLAKYTGFPLEKSYLIWFEHTLASLTYTGGTTRVVVNYDLLMQDPLGQLQRIGKTLGRQIDARGDDFLEYQSRFLDAGLRHIEYQIEDLRLDDVIPQKCVMLYELMLGFSADTMAIDSQDAVEEIKRLQSLHHDERFLLEFMQDCEDKLSAILPKLVERDEQVQQLNHVIAERDGQIANLGRTVESLIIDRDSQRAGLEQLQSAFTLLSQERDEQVSQHNCAVAERDGQIENIRMELSDLYSSKSWRLTSPLRKLIWWSSKLIAFPSRGKSQHSRISVAAPVQQPDEVCRISEGQEVAKDDHTFRILLVSHYCPTRAHAGGLRILDIYALIRQRCPNVQLDLLTHHRPTIDWSLDEIHHIFHNIYLSPTEDLTPASLAVLRGSPLTYDVVDLQFHQSGYQIDAFRHIGGKIVFTPMESLAKVLFLDLRAKFQLSNSLRLIKVATSIRAAAEEIGFTQKADEVVCVSRADAAFLRAVTSSRHIRGVDTGVSQFEFADALAPDFETTRAAERPCRILYVAYFGSETNVVALLWYLEHVHPLVKARVPGYVLTVVGRGDLSPFSKYRDKSIEFVGEVPAIAPHIKEARVSIAPALGGSGFRGKVNQYAVLGCPCVVSPIAFKGLSYQDGVNIFIAETPEIFADRCIQLLTDLELNDRMGKAARQLCMDRYSWSSKWAAIRKIYKLEEVE